MFTGADMGCDFINEHCTYASPKTLGDLPLVFEDDQFVYEQTFTL